ncbi:MAG: hypothetical protein UY60_C0004G0012 [Parcubacteria group bacterium GW2011_GWB1_50_9]|nr:MAG: hypothetical protein UY60_C0004G0012 [Parcubacteria group bacterium GW2011_GWB1_50_9]KKW21625.1 MAG: hypothetical protein UY61_C0002G0009 [Candidatus Adlerbacteria bacterium GW2011_GWC1_50_9]
MEYTAIIGQSSYFVNMSREGYNKETMKRVRKGSRFFHGDDLTKTALDRKRRSKTEPWEKKRKKK